MRLSTICHLVNKNVHIYHFSPLSGGFFGKINKLSDFTIVFLLNNIPGTFYINFNDTITIELQKRLPPL